MADSAGPRKRRKLSDQAAPYVLRQLLDNVPLESSEGDTDVHITCVEYWNGNLYIGTSAAEILHFVTLPSDPANESSEPTFILASRLPISQSSSTDKKHGIQQIVLLPAASKACILSNGVVTFYTLPELTPAFENTKVKNCQWIGGLDLNIPPSEDAPELPVVMIAVQNRIMLVRIGEEARRIRNIEFPRCLTASRRGTIACVADDTSYSLLDVEHQQKIHLFPISSSSEVFETGVVEDIPQGGSLVRSSSASYGSREPRHSSSGHGRSTSLNTSIEGLIGGRQQSSRNTFFDRLRNDSPESISSTDSPRRSTSQDPREPSGRDLLAPPAHEGVDRHKPLPPAPRLNLTPLKPHIVSPTPSEFLLVTGTEAMEPGVGMFVNMDGDVVRGTVEFLRYPEAVVVDDGGDSGPSGPGSNSQEGYILAVVGTHEEDGRHKYLEIQQWDVEPGEGDRPKFMLPIPTQDTDHVGIRQTTGPSQLNLSGLGDLLRRVRLKLPRNTGRHMPLDEPDPRTRTSIERVREEKALFESQEQIDPESGRVSSSAESLESWEAERIRDEANFARDVGKVRSSLVVWSGNCIWRVLKNPLPLHLNDVLQKAQVWEDGRFKFLHRDAVVDLIQSIEDTEARTEADFLGLAYIRQKAALLLFADLLSKERTDYSDEDLRTTEAILTESDLDPRLVLLLVPFLQEEVLQGPQGIWVQRGLAQVTEFYLEHLPGNKRGRRVPTQLLLDMVKRYLLVWQGKRGYGSITDEAFVIDSVDAALLHLLLEQDAQLLRESRPGGAIRAELYRLVDNWKGNFDRAVVLLEEYNRLFVLSRLYQSRKMSGRVLETWRRIAEQGTEADPDFTASAAEAHMRKYLVRIRDEQLVEEYGTWLASRNPALGIQVFSDDSSRVKLDPPSVVQMLKERAPNAVQDYLEHLVFAKHYRQYADDLIGYYLDTVINVLQSSPEARTLLKESYSTYRALQPPKPTYLNFITVNAPPDAWWQSRLRLLQLLGGPSTQYTSAPGGDLPYSISTVLSRIEPFQNELVSESIILDGRQGRHREALHLLTHGLGDYDSAIRYCLYGGASITQPAAMLPAIPSTPPPEKGAEAAEEVKKKKELFAHLLAEFLQIEDVSERVERTSDLLARFTPWFDVNDVLAAIPDHWGLDTLSGFLTRVFRTLIAQGREARVQRALSAGLNLLVSVEHVERMEKMGGWIEDREGSLRAIGKKPADAARMPQPIVQRENDDGENDANAGSTADEEEFGEMVG